MKTLELFWSYLSAELAKLFGKIKESKKEFKSKRSFDYSEKEMETNEILLIEAWEFNQKFDPRCSFNL